MKVRLSVQHKKANVKSVVLHTDAIIGRSTECNLRLASGQVSRRHCKLLISDEQVAVVDLGSSNGTFLNDEKLTPKVEVPIPPGSELSIGPAKFVVQYDDPAAETHIRKGASAAVPVAEEIDTGEDADPVDSTLTSTAQPASSPAEEGSSEPAEDMDIEISDDELEALLAEEGFEPEEPASAEFQLEENEDDAGPTSETLPFQLPDDDPAPEEFSPETPQEQSPQQASDVDDDDEEDLMKFLHDMD